MAVSGTYEAIARPGEFSGDGRNDGAAKQPNRVPSPSEARKMNDAILSVWASESQIASIRPPLPQINPFPSRDGYTQPPGIEDILDVTRLNPRIDDFSGTNAGYNSTSRNSLGDI